MSKCLWHCSSTKSKSWAVLGKACSAATGFSKLAEDCPWLCWVLGLCPLLSTPQHVPSDTAHFHQARSLFPPPNCKCNLHFDAAVQSSPQANPHPQQPLPTPKERLHFVGNIQGAGKETSSLVPFLHHPQSRRSKDSETTPF